MRHCGYSRALYVAVNKNDDSVYCERLELNQKYADGMTGRAREIISGNTAPVKLHEDLAEKGAYVCGWCPAKGVCHEDGFARRNCRTCISATPTAGGEDSGWRCDHHGKALSIEEQRAGCKDHRYLPDLVPGRQVDADPERRAITYVLRGGKGEWIDGQA